MVGGLCTVVGGLCTVVGGLCTVVGGFINITKTTFDIFFYLYQALTSIYTQKHGNKKLVTCKLVILKKPVNN